MDDRLYSFCFKGTHLEGPFINVLKYGAHDKALLRQGFTESKNFGVDVFEEVYGQLENVRIITLAPELPGMFDIIPQLTQRGIVVSAGHSAAQIDTGEKAVRLGVNLITHLF